MLRVRELRVDYDSVCAVRDVSLAVDSGEVCGLIGPNGAGKTTTMRAMLGLIEPTYGQVEIMGIDVHDHPREAVRHVGFMPDFPPLYDDLMAWEFLDLFAASYFIRRAERPAAVEAALARVGLTEKRRAMIPELSRGMRQRLMLAKTLIPDPKVLLLDEPASGVDPQGRIDLKNIIRELAAEGKTILISSHILTEMDEFCTSVAIMERGSVVVHGRLDEVNARIMGDSLIAVEILDGHAEFHRIITADPRAGDVLCRENVFEFRYRGDAAAASDLLVVLIQSGVRVASFAPRRDNLEELFLKVGAKELS